MSRYFPHTAYAEDQPLAKTILTTHIETRAIATGTIVGGAIYGAKDAMQRIRKSKPAPSLTVPRSHVFLRYAGSSTLWTLGFVSVGLVGRFWGKEEIEWKDRSWRLLENKGQLAVDDWTYPAMAAGLAATAFLKRPVGWVAMVGSVGTGSVVGMLGYMGWRHGLHRGKFED
ncbi:hypothetical protein F5Y18DRAFT_153398 [Xylariaceae sp. FL1019]|nr:hypothetical protein F5Y18DRAFT_153398 [Xylariaceae sp. FL1019]